MLFVLLAGCTQKWAFLECVLSKTELQLAELVGAFRGALVYRNM